MLMVCIILQGFPPFSGSTPDETWVNLKNWPKVLRRPVYDKPEDLIFNLTDQAWEAVVQSVQIRSGGYSLKVHTTETDQHVQRTALLRRRRTEYLLFKRSRPSNSTARSPSRVSVNKQHRSCPCSITRRTSATSIRSARPRTWPSTPRCSRSRPTWRPSPSVEGEKRTLGSVSLSAGTRM